MDALDVQHLPNMVRLTYRVLATRVLLFLALLMTFGLFCWAMAIGTPLSLVTAASFAILVFLMVLIRSTKGAGDASETP